MSFSDLRSTGVLAVVRREIRPLFSELRRLYFNRIWGMDIGPKCRISFSAKLDTNYPRGIHIGERTAVSFRASILSHDYTRSLHVNTWIGKDCQIGAHSVIMPGIRVGDHCIVAAGSVVMKDVPPNSLVAGNPARVMEKGIQTGPWGIIRRTVQADLEPVSSSAEEKAPS